MPDSPSTPHAMLREPHLHTFLYPRARERYWEADDALYDYESPFYRYAATGFPMIFADRRWAREWEIGRRALEERLSTARRTMEALAVRGKQ